MKSLSSKLTAIQEMANGFDGDCTIKNSKGKYIFANDNWLKLTGLTRKKTIGKSAKEIFPEHIASYIEQTDSESLRKTIHYEDTILLNGKEIKSIVIKWVVRFESGEPFLLCMLSARPENWEKINSLSRQIDRIAENAPAVTE